MLDLKNFLYFAIRRHFDFYEIALVGTDGTTPKSPELNNTLFYSLKGASWGYLTVDSN